ncbi:MULTISPECIES: endonuclease domain-containing protein [unclassified Sphingomonas]|uniref:endonuclease domain-containing protein n=1 Tax=unclassified Sphingomonas TaxID=196159 RepID=UPI000AD25FB8|nr:MULTISPECIES: endonuclease domain-containing protein [unclassified Sphingomonas]
MPKADEELLARARQMRADPMPAETAMRHILRATQFEDVKFARQRVIAPYIADFVARSRRLGVEIDGDTHAMRDVSRRTAWLERQGYGVIRFTNYDAGSNLEGVAHIIGASLAATAPLSSPLPGGERKQR